MLRYETLVQQFLFRYMLQSGYGKIFQGSHCDLFQDFSKCGDDAFLANHHNEVNDEIGLASGVRHILASFMLYSRFTKELLMTLHNPVMQIVKQPEDGYLNSDVNWYNLVFAQSAYCGFRVWPPSW